MGRVLGELTNLRNGPLSYWRAKAPFHAGVRLGLGLAQMFMAVFSAVLLIETGLNRTIRQVPSLAATPVVFLTAKSSEGDRILGLDLGADDYVSKPFSPRELVARIKAVLRRFDAPALNPVRVGEIEIDPLAMTLRVRGTHRPTTATEFRMLEHFTRHIGRVFTRNQLLDSVWRDGGYVTPRSVDVYVRRVREKIERDPENPLHLKTVRGAGYRFDAGDK